MPGTAWIWNEVGGGTDWKPPILLEQAVDFGIGLEVQQEALAELLEIEAARRDGDV